MAFESTQQLTGQYLSLGINKLTAQEEIFAQRRSQGLNPAAAARAAGFTHPAKFVASMADREDIKLCIAYLRETQRQIAINAGAIEFTKDDATVLYLEAHAKSETAMEEIRAVDSLVKLHGLATPEKVELNITRRDQLEEMDDEALLKIAGQDIALSPQDYQVVEEVVSGE